MTTQKTPSEELDIDEILTKAFNDYYNYITEKDIIKAAHEYSEKTAFNEAKAKITKLINEASLEARIDEYDALIEVWANPPQDKTGREEDYLWGAREIIDSLQFLKETRIKSLRKEQE